MRKIKDTTFTVTNVHSVRYGTYKVTGEDRNAKEVSAIFRDSQLFDSWQRFRSDFWDGTPEYSECEMYEQLENLLRAAAEKRVQTHGIEFER